MANGQNEPISRAELRAELGSLELRLVRELQKLAPIQRVEDLELRVLTRDAVKEMIGEALRESEARGWTTRERVMGVTLFLLTIASFALNLLALK